MVRKGETRGLAKAISDLSEAVFGNALPMLKSIVTYRSHQVTLHNEIFLVERMLSIERYFIMRYLF